MLEQDIKILAPGRTDVSGIKVTQTGTAPDLRRKYVCAGGGESLPVSACLCCLRPAVLLAGTAPNLRHKYACARGS